MSQTEIGQAEVKVRRSQAAFRHSAEELGEVVRQGVHRAHEVAEKVRRPKQLAKQWLHDGREAADRMVRRTRSGIGQISGRARRANDTLTAYVQEEPVPSVTSAFAFGFMIGAIGGGIYRWLKSSQQIGIEESDMIVLEDAPLVTTAEMACYL
jgi:ElaB/YqjD/DUF883 family membrane-anchored ribosome-binding protein